jgi:membrane protein implicated in regulation of membrane protease activity
MNQSKLESAVEQFLNVGSGFIISWVFWVTVITPVYDIQVTTSQNLQITAAFTVISVIRGYVWRRVFNRRLLHKLLER